MKKKSKKLNKSKFIEKSQRIESKIERRYKILIVIIILLMIGLISRLAYIQLIDHDKYVMELDELTHTVFYGNSTPRGRMYDRNGNVLVDNIALKTIYYKKPINVKKSDEIKIAYKVADYINVDFSNLRESSLKDFWIDSNPKLAKQKITDDEWKKLNERKITNNDIYKLKLERVTEEELSKYNDTDKEAAYIYYLMNKGYSYSEKTIKNKDVTDEEYAIIAEHLDELNGVNVKLDWQRYYPYGDTLKSIFGTVSSSDSGVPIELKEHYLDLGYALTDRVGTSYLEYQYEEFLKGTKDVYELTDDNSYKIIKEGSRGNDIVLTIDINLQQQVDAILTEELLAAKTEYDTGYLNKAFVVIEEPNTGEILAMSGKQVLMGDDGEYKVYDYTPGVITTSVTPGSIIKGASHIVGYNTGALQIGEKRDDACIKIAATPLKCSYKTFGVIDDLQALKYSSNTYQFQTAIKVGKGHYVYDGPLKIDVSAFDTYRNTFAQFGLGVKTNIDLPNETLGYKGNNTLSGYLLDFSIGQYDTYTPIQLSQYITTIASNGKRLKPHLLKAVYSSETEEPLNEKIYESNTEILNEVDTKEEYLNRVKEGFRQVLDVGGTGSGYVNYDYKAAGKTGTAESFIDTDGDGKIDTETISSNFVGYAPYDNPKVTFIVSTPDVASIETDSSNMSKINMRITQKVTQKYFEIYK